MEGTADQVKRLGFECRPQGGAGNDDAAENSGDHRGCDQNPQPWAELPAKPQPDCGRDHGNEGGGNEGAHDCPQGEELELSAEHDAPQSFRRQSDCPQYSNARQFGGNGGTNGEAFHEGRDKGKEEREDENDGYLGAIDKSVKEPKGLVVDDWPIGGKVRGGVGVDDGAGKRGVGEAEHDEPLAVAAVASECPKVGVVVQDAAGAGQVGGHDGVSNQLRDGKFSSRYYDAVSGGDVPVEGDVDGDPHGSGFYLRNRPIGGEKMIEAAGLGSSQVFDGAAAFGVARRQF